VSEEMNRDTVRAVLSENRQTVVSLAVTLVLLGSLVAVATPSAAVETTLTGPEEVDRNDRVTATATVDVVDGERIPIDAFELTLSPRGSDDELTVTFAPNGTVLDVTPERGTVARGDIRVRQFVWSLTITPTARSAPYGYGPRTGYDEERGEPRNFGYGYGYGYGYGDTPEFEYTIAFDATALDRGSFVGRLGVDTGDGTAFRSDAFGFEVTRPNDDGDGGDGDGDDSDDSDGENGDESGDGDDSDGNDGNDDDRNSWRDRVVDRLLDRFGGVWSEFLARLLDALLSAAVPDQVTSATSLSSGGAAH
jgi:hypothetical protein